MSARKEINMSWMLILICIVCWSVWSITLKVATKSISPLMVQVVVAYVQSAMAPAIFLYMKARNIPTEWTPKGVTYATVACILSSIAGLSFLTALQKAPAHLVVGLVSIYPALTLVLSVIFLGELVTVTKIAGIILIVCGTIFLSR